MTARPVRGPGGDHARAPAPGHGLREVGVVWILFGVVAAAVLVTYARVPPEELYNVEAEGIRGGLGRTLVFLNFPTALAAIAILAVVADRLRGRALLALAVAAGLLCAVTAIPGVVREGDLDPRPVNLVPATGVLLALALTVVCARRGAPVARPRPRGDVARVALAAVLVLGSIPWILAELGFYAAQVPGLGAVFMSDEPTPEPGHPELRAVHLGHHHGTDGVLFALTALLLSRTLGTFRRPRLRTALAAYLSVMLVYGLANAVQDFWLEQVVKRGWTGARLPDMLRPEPTLAWAALLVAAVAVYVVLLRTRREPEAA